MFVRPIHHTLWTRLHEPRRFMQVLAGPRQTGKTTLARQVTDALDRPVHRASADEPTLQDRAWLRQQWDIGRLRAEQASGPDGAVLVLDEIQKISGWSEVVKRLWDEDTGAARPLQVVLLGSAPWHVRQGLSESLAGRFELIPVTHWSYTEMRDAFGWTLDRYLYFGGYPGAAPLVDDEERWRRYILDSLIETTISRDVLLMARVEKPALLRQLFQLGCAYSGQVLSYNKMLGQLQDAGNTTTLAHYLELLAAAGMVTGLRKYAGGEVRKRASSPKLQVLNTALMSALSGRSFDAAREDRSFWGRLTESAVGAHLVNSAAGTNVGVGYWRERSHEVDFVLSEGPRVVGIEVKSGQSGEGTVGMQRFVERFSPRRVLLVGTQGIALDELLSLPSGEWIR